MPQDRSQLDRREFLKLAAVTVAAGAVGLPGCDDEADEPGFGSASAAADVDRVFPQGVASGDPKPDSVVLWTRAELPGPATVDYEVATDEAFANVVARGSLDTDDDVDHTVRLKVTELDPGTTYYYRFRADGVVTDWGRTRTAPAPDADVEVTLAFASCQDYNGRYYHAWRALADRDDVDFVVFLGDWIYETGADPRFQDVDEERGVTIADGLDLTSEGGRKAALTLADYRGLYKQYGADADLKRARRLFPFVTIWDDHEFADDCWQDHSTHFAEKEGDEKNTARRTAANRAWFEFLPVDVAHDPSKSYPDDITIYRSLRFGKHVELFVTDQRSYRDDHLIPEGPTNDAVGKLQKNTILGARQFVYKPAFDELEAATKPTILGADQKRWLLDGLGSSDATWKLWGNQVMHGQLAVDLSDIELLPESFRGVFYITVDQWDGYRSERAEILSAIAGVDNVVVLTGDLHATYVNELQVDFDAPGQPVAVEFVCPGISSRSLEEIIERVVEEDDLLSNLGIPAVVPQLDQRAADFGPHVRFVKNRSYGIGWAKVGAGTMDVRILEVDGVTDRTWDGAVTEHRFSVAAGTSRVIPAG